jgi:hypothetical protein
MHITRSSIDTMRGPGDLFTGDVYVDTIAAPSPPSRLRVHVAMQEADDTGSPVTSGDHVTDDEYRAPA